MNDRNSYNAKKIDAHANIRRFLTRATEDASIRLASPEWHVAKRAWPLELTSAVQKEVELNFYKIIFLKIFELGTKGGGDIIVENGEKLFETYTPFLLCNGSSVFETGYSLIRPEHQASKRRELLQLCAFSGNEETFTKLCRLLNIKIGSTEYIELITRQDDKEWLMPSVLHIAAYSNNIKLLQFLCQTKKPEKYFALQETSHRLHQYGLLLFAVMGGALDTMEYCHHELGIPILDLDINPIGIFGASALSYSPETMKKLLEWGCELTSKDFKSFKENYNHAVAIGLQKWRKVFAPDIDMLSELASLPGYTKFADEEKIELEKRAQEERLEQARKAKTASVISAIIDIKNNFLTAADDLSEMSSQQQSIDIDVLNVLVSELGEEAEKNLFAFDEIAKDNQEIKELQKAVLSLINNKTANIIVLATSLTNSMHKTAPPPSPTKTMPKSGDFSYQPRPISSSSSTTHLLGSMPPQPSGISNSSTPSYFSEPYYDVGYKEDLSSSTHVSHSKSPLPVKRKISFSAPSDGSSQFDIEKYRYPVFEEEKDEDEKREKNEKNEKNEKKR